VLADLCEQNFLPVFQAISEEVIADAQLSCEFVIPPLPAGESYDPAKVIVRLTTEQGESTIGRVETAADCANVAHGWYYDDPMSPSRIVMCPQTCADFQLYGLAEINIELGCETAPTA
jgi:hypothetical protein